ncbi:MAG: Gfo/Idh/MocA family oxidoreductase [Rhodobacteraceae bacterium]|nr:Gfo/Idh/MocA family oxidoreductase [Paracoccaceae bacterium]
MNDTNVLGAAIIGTGFIGVIHCRALRQIGVKIVGVLGSSQARSIEAAAEFGVSRAYSDIEELVADCNVDVVHVTSPNHAHFGQVKTILEAGKHVVCEKPLAPNAAQTQELVALGKTCGKICAVCYNLRFYPLNQHAHQMVREGEVGEIRMITGHYHQDWLAKPTDWNWRLEVEKGGVLRSVADIGTHWIDLVEFISGEKVISVFADLATFVKTRQKPKGRAPSFANTDSGKTEPHTITTDDAAMIMLRFSDGAKGVMSTSQISIGRKNSVKWDIVGSKVSAAWDSESPDHLFIGQRDAPNQILQRDPGLMNKMGAATAELPGGHVEGFGDTFAAMFKQIYNDVNKNSRSDDATYASFSDGHDAVVFCEAVTKSAHQSQWVDL